MTETETREWCDYAWLHKDECAHCNPDRTATQRTAEQERLLALRAKVERVLLNRATTVLYPGPKVRTERRPMSIGKMPKRDSGNVAAEIGRYLTSIEDMFDALKEEAENRYRDREFPGGDAMVMLGPGADVEAFNYRQISAMVGRIDEQDVVIAVKGDIDPPLSVLVSWEDTLRQERDQPVYLRATIGRACKYIRDSIDWMLSTDENNTPRFVGTDDLAAQLGKVRRRMEDILKDGTRAEFTRVHCIAPDCDTHPRLMKLWAAQIRWDRYRCPNCRIEYDKDMYAMAKSQNLHDRGIERFIAPLDAAEGAGVPIKTVRSWMKRRKAERRWVTPLDGNPFAEVWWPDVRDLADERRDRLDRQAIRRKAIKAEKAAEAKRKADEHDSSERMKRMNITEFLLARIDDDEDAARGALMRRDVEVADDGPWRLWWQDVPSRLCVDPTRALAECQSKRAIIELHQQWPVLAETAPTFEPVDSLDINAMTYRASREIAWLTEQEYRKRFGSEPPTTPMLAAMAAVYADHPDYLPEWSDTTDV